MKFQEQEVTGLTKDPKQDDFHFVYFKFRAIIAELEFLNGTLPNLFTEYFLEWSDSLNRKILNFNYKENREYRKFLKQNANPDVKSTKLHQQKVMKFVGEHVRFVQYNHHIEFFIKEMALVYLITQFENFLKDLLLTGLKKKPEIFISDKLTETKHLFTVNTLEEAQKIVVDEILDDLMRKDIEKINKFLKEKFKLELSKLKDWKKFTERFYRRNVIIHNDGYPNDIYREKTGLNKKYRLFVTDSYFKETLNLFDNYSHTITDHIESKLGKK